MGNPVTFSIRDYVNLKLYYTLINRDIAKNTSRVKIELYAECGNGQTYNLSGGLSWNIKINRSTKHSGSGVTYDFRSTSYVLVGSWEGDVTHNADGTLTIEIEGYASDGFLGSATATMSQTLTTIPRATQLSVDPYSVTMGDTITISMPRASEAFTHKLWYRFKDGQWHVIGSGLGISYSWTVPEALASQIPNSLWDWLEFSVETFHGTTKIGEKNGWAKAYVPSTVVPTIGNVSAIETVTGLAAQFGGLVKDKSKIRIVTPASGSYGSTISSISTFLLGATYTGGDITSGVLTMAGTVTIATTVTDSRGRTATKNTPLPVADYFAPAISRFKVFRALSDGTIHDNGTFARVSAKCNIAPVHTNNDKTWQVDYREKGTSPWTTVQSGSVYTYDSAFTSSSAILNSNKSYEFRFTVADYFTTNVLLAEIGTTFKLMNWNATGGGMAVGKASEKEAFEVGIKTEFNDVAEFLEDPVIKGERPWAYHEIIPSGANLNTYVTSGLFRCPTNAAAQTMSHCPTVYAFTLRISRTTTDGVIQELIVYAPDGPRGFHRAYYSGTWGAWMEAWTNYSCPASLAASGYQRMANGLILQWGSASVPGNAGYLSVTLPVAMTLRAIQIVPQYDGSGIANPSFRAQISSTTKFNAYVRHGGTGVIPSTREYFFWLAIGHV